jgi:hypothetical protein
MGDGLGPLKGFNRAHAGAKLEQACAGRFQAR